MARAKERSRESFQCPMAKLWERLGGLKDRRSPFWEHMTKAKIEVLEAFKSLLEERIERLRSEGEKLTKIEVE